MLRLTKNSESWVRPNPNLIQKQGQIYIDIYCLTRYIHGFYCETSLQYGEGKNSKAYHNLWWKYEAWSRKRLATTLHLPHKIYLRYLQ